MGNMYFDSMIKFQAAFSDAGNLMADIPNFTDIQPQVQISEVMLQESINVKIDAGVNS